MLCSDQASNERCGEGKGEHAINNPSPRMQLPSVGHHMHIPAYRLWMRTKKVWPQTKHPLSLHAPRHLLFSYFLAGHEAFRLLCMRHPAHVALKRENEASI